ncbi:MAG: DUF1573 domain-containing protein [Deltaproteobacteria bacterium]|nr:DUF1573 domain-containing protein [Deltaproteobacteria bacterium]
MRQMRVLFAVMGLCFLISLSQAEAANPRISFQEKDYNFGTVKEGTEVTHEFSFRNGGDADLVITDVKTSCGCTAAVTSAKTIASGKSGTLKVTFNSRGRRGHQTKTITVYSNDPGQPRAAVRLEGEVDAGDQPKIFVNPMRLDIGVVPPGESVVRELSVSNKGTAELVLENFVGRNSVAVETTGGAKIERTVKPQKTVKIRVIVTPKKREGVYQGYLQIRNNSLRRIVTVPVYGYVSDKYELKPQYR